MRALQLQLRRSTRPSLLLQLRINLNRPQLLSLATSLPNLTPASTALDSPGSPFHTWSALRRQRTCAPQRTFLQWPSSCQRFGQGIRRSGLRRQRQFRLRRITDETTKFTHVVASLTKEYAVEVRELLLSPPPTVPYITLKEALIRRTSDSESSKLQQLLSTADLGDQKPSQLLRNMERLVGGKSIDAGLFRQLFLQRLPRNVAMVLEATSTSVDLSTQAEIADKLMQLNDQPSFGRTVSAVWAPPESSVSADVAALRAEVAALTETIAHWQPSRGRSWTRHSSSDQSRRRSSSRNHGQSPGRTLHNDGVRYYHQRFGSAARKCAPHCAHPASGSTPSTSDPSGNATAKN